MKKIVTTLMTFVLASCLFMLEAHKPPKHGPKPKPETEEGGSSTDSTSIPPVPIIWW